LPAICGNSTCWNAFRFAVIQETSRPSRLSTDFPFPDV
jgi:hypothetical protein